MTETQMTSYVVMRRSRAAVIRENSAPSKLPEQWEVVATVSARSAEAAVREAALRPAAENANTVGGAQVLVAVPTRSWNPVSVTQKVETTLVLGDVSA